MASRHLPDLYLSGTAAADTFLAEDPFALLIGMVLDQQVPMERAFSAPYELRTRLNGELSVKGIATMPTDALVAAFSEKPALHRFPAAMAERTQLLARTLLDRFDGDAAAVWERAADGTELMHNVRTLPGFGEQKARIFIALLGKRLGVNPPGWERAAGAFGAAGTFASVADIDGPDALAKVRQHKADVKAAQKSVTAQLGTARRPSRRPSPR
jgi:uncharacterized HhH-GPD family protein